MTGRVINLITPARLRQLLRRGGESLPACGSDAEHEALSASRMARLHEALALDVVKAKPYLCFRLTDDAPEHFEIGMHALPVEPVDLCEQHQAVHADGRPVKGDDRGGEGFEAGDR